MENQVSFDALLPRDMAAKAEAVGVAKANLGPYRMFALAVLAGAFIALGAIFATTVTAGGIALKAPDGVTAFSTGLPYGLTRLLAGLVFSLGLILVIVGGAELFTGNNLIVMAWANRKVSTQLLLRNWVLVYLGNFVGAFTTALLMFVTRQYALGDGAVGAAALATANAKTGLEFWQAAALGVMCNGLVCLAVWLTFSARTTTDKILAIVPPISAFVAAGFEHSIANMYFIPIGLFVKAWAPADFWAKIGRTTADYANLTWDKFLLSNLVPVTLGNIIGGVVMVGLVYWFIYLRPSWTGRTEAAPAGSSVASPPRN